jgi:hypothetical protein
LGVVAEIGMFAADERFLQRFSAQTLFLIGASGCVVRWLLLGASTELMVLVVAQLLHGVTFCISHLAAVRFITRQLPAEQMIAAQALYSALALGMMVAVLMTVAGQLFHHGCRGGAGILLAVAAGASWANIKSCGITLTSGGITVPKGPFGPFFLR